MAGQAGLKTRLYRMPLPVGPCMSVVAGLRTRLYRMLLPVGRAL